MKHPEFITFTGIDDRTDLTRADKLAGRYDIEWGVLFSANNRDARFPCQQAVDEIQDIFGPKSAHLCGKLSRDVQSGEFSGIWFDKAKFWRMQINGGKVHVGNFDALRQWANVKIITQTRGDSFSACDSHELFDRSGGNGEMPQSIPRTCEHKMVGFAGGMGPDTVMDYINMIEGDGRFWIDMEGRVRTNGWLDLDKVEAVCQAVFQH